MMNPSWFVGELFWKKVQCAPYFFRTTYNGLKIYIGIQYKESLLLRSNLELEFPR
jgi:hypothetical protein